MDRANKGFSSERQPGVRRFVHEVELWWHVGGFFDLGRSLGRGWGEGGPADGEGGTSLATRKPPGASRWCVGRPPGVSGGEAVGGPGSHRRGEQRGNCLGRSGREGKAVRMGTE